MTLLEALDQARFVDLSWPVGAPALLQAVLQWKLRHPDKVAELYRLTGIPENIGVVHPSTPKINAYALRMSKKTSARIVCLLSERDHTLTELTRAVGRSEGTVRTTVSRLRDMGLSIGVLTTGPKKGTYHLDQGA